MVLEAHSNDSYNNADSFSMAFDSAWRDNDIEKNKQLNIDEKIDITLKKIENHPFLIDNPSESKNIALFRIKLLGLR